VKGILVTESVRGDGGVLRNTAGKRFMFDYVPDVFRKQYADTEAEADRWYDDPDGNRRPPELLPRDEVARAINTEVKEGRGTEAGGVLLDIASRLPADQIRKRLPSMYHQFKELADVDITEQPMEVGPTCHYVMGGVEVDADTAEAVVPGLYAAGEVSGGMHGSNRLGGNSLSDLLVFGKRAGEYAARFAGTVVEAHPRQRVLQSEVDAAVEAALAPLARADAGENPYTLHAELQEVMQSLVGIIRRKPELEEALVRLAELKERVKKVGVGGGRRYNPGWHLALDLRNMVIVSESTARAALEREESRGGHTREDFPAMDPTWRRINLVCRLDGEDVALERKDVPTVPVELLRLFDRSELAKYMTGEELAVLAEGGA
jgi:succinate dehydrogenase / fumarate reductase flavoprotein subunit